MVEAAVVDTFPRNVSLTREEKRKKKNVALGCHFLSYFMIMWNGFEICFRGIFGFVSAPEKRGPFANGPDVTDDKQVI